MVGEQRYRAHTGSPGAPGFACCASALPLTMPLGAGAPWCRRADAQRANVVSTCGVAAATRAPSPTLTPPRPRPSCPSRRRSRMFQTLRTFGVRDFTQLSCHDSHMEDGVVDVSAPVARARRPALRLRDPSGA